MLAGDLARLYEVYTVPEAADILGVPLDRAQAALVGIGVLTPAHAAGLRRQGWSNKRIAREWGMAEVKVREWTRTGGR